MGGAGKAPDGAAPSGESPWRTGRVPETLAEKIDWLFWETTPPGERPPSHETVARAINAAAGEQVISNVFLWQLRNEKRDNVTTKRLEAIAQYFDTPVAFFFDDSKRDKVMAEYRVLRALGEGDAVAVSRRGEALDLETLVAMSDALASLIKDRMEPDTD